MYSKTLIVLVICYCITLTFFIPIRVEVKEPYKLVRWHEIKMTTPDKATWTLSYYESKPLGEYLMGKFFFGGMKHE